MYVRKRKIPVCDTCFCKVCKDGKVFYVSTLILDRCRNPIFNLKTVDNGNLFVDVSDKYKPCSCRNKEKH